MYLNTLNNYSIGCDFFALEDTHSINHISYKDKKSLLNLPLNWLSKLLNKNGIDYTPKSDDIVIIDNTDNLPEEIVQYIQPVYTKYYPYIERYGSFIGLEGESEYQSSLEHYIKFLKNNRNHFISCGYLEGNCFLFKGITLKNLYNLMFHSTLKQEEILRYLDATEFDYSIDTNKINEEVEKILAKH